MKTFKQYIKEEVHFRDMWSAIKISDKDGNTVGKILRDKQNSTHADIQDKHLEKIHAARDAGHNIERGFYHRNTGFLSREEAAKYSSRNKSEVDSTDKEYEGSKIRRAPEWSSDDPEAGSASSGGKETVMARMRRLGFAEEKNA